MIDPTHADIGRAVIYRPHGQPPERGRLVSFNQSYAFVVYGGFENGQATRREDLEWEHETTPSPVVATAYLVWSEEHRAWWKAGGWGYTTSIVEAGRFTKERADEIVTQANFAPHIFNEIAVPVPAGVPARATETE